MTRYFIFCICILLHPLLLRSQDLFITSILGYTKFYTVQSGLPPFYLDNKGGTGLGFNTGMVLDKKRDWSPILELGYKYSNLRLAHFNKIIDSFNNVVLIDEYKINFQFLSLTTSFQKRLNKNLNLVLGLSANKCFKEKENIISYTIDDNKKVQSGSKQINTLNSKPLLMNAAISIQSRVSDKVVISLQNQTGLTFLRNHNDGDFLAKEFSLFLTAKVYLFKF